MDVPKTAWNCCRYVRLRSVPSRRKASANLVTKRRNWAHYPAEKLPNEPICFGPYVYSAKSNGAGKSRPRWRFNARVRFRNVVIMYPRSRPSGHARLGYDVSCQRRTNSLPAGNLAGNISNLIALANLTGVIAFCLNGLFEKTLLVPGREFASVASVRQGISIELTLAVSIVLRYLPTPYISN